MYRLNTLNRNVLIMTDEVIRHAPTKHTLDPRMIENSIIIAEERFIVPALGWPYYKALINSKNKVITDANKSVEQDKINASLPQGAQAVVLKSGDVVNAAEYLSNSDKELWDYILWKLIAECVLILAYPEGFIQFGSSGVIHEQPGNSAMISSGAVTPDLRSMKWVMDRKMMDRVDPLLESMHNWVCDQKKIDKTKYLLYGKDCGCDAKGNPNQKRSDILLGLYDDIDND